MFWDYHVIFLHKITCFETVKIESESMEPKLSKKLIGAKSFIYDFDTVLGFCNEFENYFEKTFSLDKSKDI